MTSRYRQFVGNTVGNIKQPADVGGRSTTVLGYQQGRDQRKCSDGRVPT